MLRRLSADGGPSRLSAPSETGSDQPGRKVVCSGFGRKAAGCQRGERHTDNSRQRIDNEVADARVPPGSEDLRELNGSREYHQCQGEPWRIPRVAKAEGQAVAQ
jgi:hypothetical protein